MDVRESNDNQELSLKWNNFTQNIVTSLESSFGNQDFVDVTLVCEGGTIKAHRLILSACSFFFQRIFKDNVCPHPIIVVKGITLTELKTLLVYMYHGEARTNENDFPRLLEAAQFLEIRGLTNEPNEETSCSKIKKENIGNQKDNTCHLGGEYEHSSTRRCQAIPSLEPVIHDVRTLSQNHDISSSVNTSMEASQEANEKLEWIFKQEIDEKDPFEDNIPAQIEFIQAVPVVSTRFVDNIGTDLPGNGLSVLEYNVMQEQKKLAFYEPRPCPKCKRVYRDAATLRTHMTIMHEVLAQKISCSCGMMFSTKHDLYTHRKKGHKR